MVCLISDQIGPVWTWGSVSLFPKSMYEVRVKAEQGVFDDNSDRRGMCLVVSFLLNAIALFVGILSLRQVTQEKHESMIVHIYCIFITKFLHLSCNKSYQSPYLNI